MWWWWLVLLLSPLTLLLVRGEQRGLSTHEKDLLCACRAFRTPFSNMETLVARDLQGKDVVCETHGFSRRWMPLFSKSAESELGVGWGLRAQVYVNRPENKPDAMLVAFKHFEHDTDTWVSRDWWQMFAYHGDETHTAYLGAHAAYWLSAATQVARHLLAVDYTREASNMMKEIMGRSSTPARLYITGFGAGGSIAAIQAARLKSTSAVVFMAHGVGQMLPFYGYAPSRRVVNVVVQGAQSQLLGRQANRVCVVDGTGVRADVLEYLYDGAGLVANNGSRVCVDELEGESPDARGEL